MDNGDTNALLLFPTSNNDSSFKSCITQKGVNIMEKICFETKIFEINSWRIIQFPKQSSEKLPSRGMVMVKGTMNDIYFETPLEPDGMGSH